MIRPTTTADVEPLMALVESSGQFDPAGLAHVRDTLVEALAGSGDCGWWTVDDGEPVGVAFCAPEPVTVGTWNLHLLWVREDRQERGYGAALVDTVEAALVERGARLLLVETSSLPAFAVARAFYARCGFRHEATVREFYDAGDDKLVYTRRVGARD